MKVLRDNSFMKKMLCFAILSPMLLSFLMFFSCILLPYSLQDSVYFYVASMAMGLFLLFKTALLIAGWNNKANLKSFAQQKSISLMHRTTRDNFEKIRLDRVLIPKKRNRKGLSLFIWQLFDGQDSVIWASLTSLVLDSGKFGRCISNWVIGRFNTEFCYAIQFSIEPQKISYPKGWKRIFGSFQIVLMEPVTLDANSKLMRYDKNKDEWVNIL